jgi:hypothetical protein
VKTAYIPGFDGFAIKVSPGFFDNPKLGLPSLNGLMILFSAKTGLVEALFLDNGYLTDIRTAAAARSRWRRNIWRRRRSGRRRDRHRRAGAAADRGGASGAAVRARAGLGPRRDKASACAADIAAATGSEARRSSDPARAVAKASWW